MARESSRYPSIGVVETDAFCAACGRNLHQQVIVRDELLGILFARCPNCRKLEAAAPLTSTQNKVLNRFAVATLRFYVLSVCFFATIFGFFLLVIDEEYMQQIRWRGDFLHSATEVPLVGAVVSFMAAVLAATFMWHWRTLGRLATISATIPIGVLSFALRRSYDILPTFWLDLVGVLVPTIMQVVAMATGFWLGRPLARLALRAILPPRVRQRFAFLWFADGKRPPKATGFYDWRGPDQSREGKGGKGSGLPTSLNVTRIPS